MSKRFVVVTLMLALAIGAQGANSVKPGNNNGGQLQAQAATPPPDPFQQELYEKLQPVYEEWCMLREMMRELKHAIDLQDTMTRELKKNSNRAASLVLKSVEDMITTFKEFRATVRETQKTALKTTIGLGFKAIMAGIPADAISEPARQAIELIFEATMFTGENAGTILKIFSEKDANAAMELLKSFGTEGVVSLTDKAVSHTWEQVVTGIGKLVVTKMSEEGLKKVSESLPVFSDCLTIYDLIKSAYTIHKQYKKTKSIVKFVIYTLKPDNIFKDTDKMLNELKEHNTKLGELNNAFQQQKAQANNRLVEIKNWMRSQRG